MKKIITLMLLLTISYALKAQDTIKVTSINKAIFETKKGNFIYLLLQNDTSKKFPKAFKKIPKKKLLGLTFDNCNYTSFPSYLGNYKHLTMFKYAWYYNIDLAPIKEIPKFIYKLNNLEHLSIERVKLFKISSKIKNLKKLRSLKLYGCKLDSFPKEILRLNKLTYLNLSCNNFTAIPSEISQLKQLKFLNFEGGACGATPIAAIPTNIGELKELQYLGLGYAQNPIKELPKSFYQLKKLKSFTCHGCGLESLSEEIGNLKQLARISLTNLGDFNPFPQSFFSLPNLQTFRFYATDIKTKGLLQQQKKIDAWGKKIESYYFEAKTKDENLYQYIID